MSQKNINYNKTETYERLKNDKEIFRTYKDVLLFLATVGYSENEKVESSNKGGEIPRSLITRDPTQKIVVRSIAYADTGDEEVLSDTDRQIDILREYANGGEEIINEVLNSPTEDSDKPNGDLEKLLEYLKQNQEKEMYGKDSGILGEIEEEIETVV